MNDIIKALVVAFKVDPRRAAKIVFAAIGVLTVALQLLQAVLTALTAAQ